MAKFPCHDDDGTHISGCVGYEAFRDGEISLLVGLLRRLREWDHLDGSADGPYWRREIERALDRHKST